jgi:hypothetical protein
MHFRASAHKQQQAPENQSELRETKIHDLARLLPSDSTRAPQQSSSRNNQASELLTKESK